MASIDQVVQGTKRCQLSLAVSLKDKYSGDMPRGEVGLFINGNDKPALNPSGYYAFINLPKGSYNVEVVSENYLDEMVPDIYVGDKYVFLEITLTPRPSYSFPCGETLVRGTLKDSNGPAPGALLEGSMHSGFSSRTDEKGEFVMFFGVLSEEDVMEDNGIIYLMSHSAQGQDREIPVECRVDDRLMQIDNKLTDVAVGTTTSWYPMLTT
jgi:hypothetical protein